MSEQQQVTPGPHRRNVPERPHPVGDKKAVALRLVAGVLFVSGLLVLVGELLTHFPSSGRSQAWDGDVDNWFAARRTGTWNTITTFGSGLANTSTAIAVTVALFLLLRWRLHRWYESWILVAAMIGELLVFVAVTTAVHRARPPVTKLDVSPPTSSFPSGHTAAATALYGCLAVLLVWIYGRRPAPRIAAAVLVCLPLVVGLSRLYRGMHYPTDVVAGALGAGLWLLIVITTLLPRSASTTRDRSAPA